MEHLQVCFNGQSSPSSVEGQLFSSSKSTDIGSHYKFSSPSDHSMSSRQRSHSGSEASDQSSLHHDGLQSSSGNRRRISSSGGGGSSKFEVAANYSESTGDLSLAELEYVYKDDDSDDDSDDGDVVYSTAEMARLLSLNERDMQEDEEEEEEVVEGDQEEEELMVAHQGLAKRNESETEKSTSSKTQKRKGSPASKKDKKKPTSSPTHSKTKEPVGLFWDIENCSVPVNKSAFVVASKLRKEFIAGKREAEFMCVCDITKERKEVTDDLNKAQVNYYIEKKKQRVMEKCWGGGGGECNSEDSL